MERYFTGFSLGLMLAGSFCVADGSIARAQSSANPPVVISSRVEMFVDSWLVDTNRTREVSLKLQSPVRREVVLTTDKPWEGKESAYFSVLQDGSRVRLYYRGFIPEGGDSSDQQVTCMVESSDGIIFTRPTLGLDEFQ